MTDPANQGQGPDDAAMHDEDAVPTTTQPSPNISTEHPQGAQADPVKPTETQPAPNLSTEYQPEGGARFPKAGLDRNE